MMISFGGWLNFETNRVTLPGQWHPGFGRVVASAGQRRLSHKHRNAFKRIARERLARGEVEDGVIQLTML
jgi:hypothetical protein